MGFKAYRGFPRPGGIPRSRGNVRQIVRVFAAESKGDAIPVGKPRDHAIAL